MTNYEMIIDPECMDNIVITNSKGTTFEFEQIALIPLHDTGYAILKPLNPELFNLKDDEPLIFKLNDKEETIELCVDPIIIYFINFQLIIIFIDIYDFRNDNWIYT